MQGETPKLPWSHPSHRLKKCGRDLESNEQGVQVKGLNTLGHQTSPIDGPGLSGTGVRLVRYFIDSQTWNFFQKFGNIKFGSKTNNLALVDHVDKILKNFDNQGHA
jgi:hypothetical protein